MRRALALLSVGCGKVASLRHRLTREMKAKCYKNMSAAVNISPASEAKEQKIAALQRSNKGMRLM
jgi:hypothetical protein